MQYVYHYMELSVSYDTQSKIRTVDIPLQIIIVFYYSKQSSTIIYILFLWVKFYSIATNMKQGSWNKKCYLNHTN